MIRSLSFCITSCVFYLSRSISNIKNKYLSPGLTYIKRMYGKLNAIKFQSLNRINYHNLPALTSIDKDKKNKNIFYLITVLF